MPPWLRKCVRLFVRIELLALYKKVPFKNWAAIKTMTRTILDKSKFRLKLFSFHLMLLGWLWKTGSGLKKSDNFIIFILVVNSWVLGSSGLLRQIGTPQSVLRRSGRHGQSSAGARPAATRRSSTKMRSDQFNEIFNS